VRKTLSIAAAVASLYAAGCLVATSSPGPKGGAESATTEPTSDTVKLYQAPAGAVALTPANTKIEWVGTKPDGRHTGGFDKFSGAVELAGDDVTKAKVTVEIDANSITSDNPKLTAHLKNPDFFEVATYPTAKFVTTAIQPADGKAGTHTITGDLTLHGQTKSISFPAKVALTADAFSLDSEFKINRTDFGMSYGKGKIHDDVTLKVAVKAPRK
jgi:polyisoprenoid-binding protein YceI